MKDTLKKYAVLLTFFLLQPWTLFGIPYSPKVSIVVIIFAIIMGLILLNDIKGKQKLYKQVLADLNSGTPKHKGNINKVVEDFEDEIKEILKKYKMQYRKLERRYAWNDLCKSIILGENIEYTILVNTEQGVRDYNLILKNTKTGVKVINKGIFKHPENYRVIHESISKPVRVSAPVPTPIPPVQRPQQNPVNVLEAEENDNIISNGSHSDDDENDNIIIVDRSPDDDDEEEEYNPVRERLFAMLHEHRSHGYGTSSTQGIRSQEENDDDSWWEEERKRIDEEQEQYEAERETENQRRWEELWEQQRKDDERHRREQEEESRRYWGH